MAALTYSRTFKDQRARGLYRYLLAAGVTIFHSAGIGEDSNGVARPWRDNATDKWLGLAVSEGAQANEPTVAVDTEGRVICGVPVAGATQARVAVHCPTDNLHEDLCLDAGATSRAIGRIIRFRSASDCDVEFFTPAEFDARYDQGTT